MEAKGSRGKWPRLIAAVAVRMNVSPNEVRRMYWCDFREILRAYGVQVQQTPDERAEQIRRLMDG